MSFHFPDAHAFLAGRQNGPGAVYVIGGLTDQRVTLVSQQRRALNIVAALRCVHGPAVATKRIAIVGAGAAGITAAAALRALGASEVVVYERAGAVMHAQRASLSRYLHPNLFHWPEAGWDEPKAALPIADWSGDYADTVRSKIMDTVGDLDVRYCTAVKSIAALSSRAELKIQRLEEPASSTAEFDLVLVATGFPAEAVPPSTPHAPKVVGGSYWHSLGELSPTEHIHLLGDGDGALTEVLMLFLATYGHQKVADLARQLPDHAELRADDLAAQADPHAHTALTTLALVPAVADLLNDLDPKTRKITIHADRALKGNSFLLNRVLVNHLIDLGAVTIDPSNKLPVDYPSLRPGQIIKRAGLAEDDRPFDFEKPAVGTKSVAEALRATRLTVAHRGIVIQALDALRRRLWSDEFHRTVRSGRGPFRAEPPSGQVLACGRLTPACDAAVADLQATVEVLLDLGLPLREDAYDPATGRFSVEAVVRTASLEHTHCVARTLKQERVHRDDLGRLWFDPAASGAKRSSAVVALVDPLRIKAWRRRSGFLAKGASAEILTGLGELASSDIDILPVTSLAHLSHRDYAEAMHDVLRYARSPALPGGRDGGIGSRTRKALLDAARIVADAAKRRHDGDLPFTRDDLPVLLAAAIGDLNVVTTGPPTTYEISLDTVRRWASRVRALPRELLTQDPRLVGLVGLADTELRLNDESAWRLGKEIRAAANEMLERSDPASVRRLASFGVRAKAAPKLERIRVIDRDAPRPPHDD